MLSHPISDMTEQVSKSLDATELIQKLHDFFQQQYYPQLVEQARKGNRWLHVEFPDLSKFDPDIADALLEMPEEVLKAAEIAIEQFDVPGDVKGFVVRFVNLPESSRIMIRNIRSIHLNKFHLIEGVVRQKSDVRPQVTEAKFECPSCGNTISMLQLDNKFKEPSRCSCGRKGKFRLLNKTLVDAQSLVLEEVPEQLEGGEQSKRLKVFLKNDLVSPLSEKKTNPGARIILAGTIKEVPIITRSGAQSTVFDLLLEANSVVGVQEEYTDITVTPEDEQQIKTLAEDPLLIKKMVQSVAPSIYGHDQVKEALLLQMLGGVRKKHDDGVIRRGDIHVLLVGDPGAAKCLPGETIVMLRDGSQKPIKDVVEPLLGREELKDVSSLNIFVPSFDSKAKVTNSKVLAVSKRKTKELIGIRTEQGSVIRATPNHPFFVIENGLIIPKSAEDLKENDFVAMARYIDCKTAQQQLPQSVTRARSRNAKHITLPPYCNEDLARFLGYLVGDGYCTHTNSSGWITLTGNDEELLDDFTSIAKRLFSVNVTKRKSHKGKSAKEVYITSRELVSYLEKLSPEITQGARRKTVPECILKSPLNVVAAFLRALFDHDGTVRLGRREVSLTSANRYLIEQVRLLLRRFGISSQIHVKYQCATNSKDKKKDFYYLLSVSGENTFLFSEYVGFSLKRKQEKIKLHVPHANTNLAVIPNISRFLKDFRTKLNISQFSMGIPRTTYQHYERGDRNPSFESIQKVISALEKTIVTNYQTPQLVLKIPEEISAKFCALKLLSESHLGWEKISKIEKQIADEYVYDLQVEENHNFIANGFVVHNSQLLKRMTIIAPKGRYVTGKGASLDYSEPLLIRKNGIIQTVPIGKFVDENYIPDAENLMIPLCEPVETLALNHDTYKLEWQHIKYVYRHKTDEPLLKLTLETGRQITVTGDHSIFILRDGKPIAVPANALTTRDCAIIPRRMPVSISPYQISHEAARLLGYYVAEGHTSCSGGSYKIEFTIHKNERQIMDDIKACAQRVLASEARVYPHGENGARVTIYGKRAYSLFAFLLGDVMGKKAKEKRIPQCIMNAQQSARKEFLQAYWAGDAGVTKSRALMSDVLYLFLQQGIIGSVNQREEQRQPVFRGRTFKSTGKRYDLKSPRPGRPYAARYTRPPFAVLPQAVLKAFFREAQSSGCVRANIVHAENRVLLHRLQAMATGQVLGKEFRELFGESALEYASDHADVFGISHEGRNALVSITPIGQEALAGLEQIRKLVDSDLGFARIKKIECVSSNAPFVYDVSVPGSESFVGGFGGIVCHNSGAGLSATVVKDEFLQGWSLEAGALVLANKGICMIDEMDKMAKEDTWAMHEALEQQCFHKDSELMLADGSVANIGQFIDTLLTQRRHHVRYQGTAEILDVDDVEVLTTDIDTIFPTKIKCVSRRPAPKEFVKIVYSNGRHLIVTPEHPLFIFRGGHIVEVPAENSCVGDLAPSPTELPTIPNEEAELIAQEKEHWKNKNIAFPVHVNSQLSRLLGYVASEGHSYYNPSTRLAEIGVTNTNPAIINEYVTLFQDVFETDINLNVRKAGTIGNSKLDCTTVRCCSIPLYKFFKKNFGALVAKAPQKRAGNMLRTAIRASQQAFLKAAFKGDGFIDSERLGYSTASYGLAKDYQDLLLQNGIWSYIAHENLSDRTYYKVVISGTKNMEMFRDIVVEADDARFDRIRAFCERSRNKPMYHDPVPASLVTDLYALLKQFRMDDGYFYTLVRKKQNSNKVIVKPYAERLNYKLAECTSLLSSNDVRSIRRRACINVKDLAAVFDVSCGTIYNYEKRGGAEYVALLKVVKKIAQEKIQKSKKILDKLFQILNAKIRFVTIKRVEKIPNKDSKWVYDITVGPTKSFISEGLVLHNSVTISKANIQATLRCETTVLAAANPKFGRFDPYDTVANQIDLPPTLINRFDLIFPIKDVPDQKKDEKLASFMLELHQNNIETPPLNTELLRKYIAYARQKFFPKLTEGAIEELKEYFIKMRSSAGTGASARSVPISARQLEGLVRLSEASARLHLRDKVLKKDAKKAIELLDYCLRQVALDEETGTIDIDRIATGMPASQRNKIMTIKEIIAELENKVGKVVPIEDIVKEASAKGLTESEIEDIVQKLKKSGDIFEPRHGFISRI